MIEYRPKEIRALAAAALCRHFLPELSHDAICRATGVTRDELRWAEQRLFPPPTPVPGSDVWEDARRAREPKGDG